jgi:hypothetical protein
MSCLDAAMPDWSQWAADRASTMNLPSRECPASTLPCRPLLQVGEVGLQAVGAGIHRVPGRKAPTFSFHNS